MDDAKKEKLNALGAKVKEHAAQSSASAEDSGAKRGLFGFGSKPAATTNNNTTTTTNAKPSLFGSKPTAAATSAKPTATTATTATSAKPTATAAASQKSAFTDVPAGAYYAEAVAWAVQKGITSGTTPTTFAPDNACHRGHVATFLWRSKGSPAPKSSNSRFTDVAADSPFYKAILWATENKIVDSKTPTTYEPTTPCTRGEVLTALYRAEGKANATQADAVKWANLKKLLTGLSGNASSPCTRADIVTFLYRLKA